MSANQRFTVQVDAIGNFSSIIGEVNKLQSRLQSLKLPSNMGNKFQGNLKDVIDKFTQFQNLASKGVQTKGDFSRLNSSAKEFEGSLRTLKKELNSISEKDIKVQVSNLPEVKALEKEVERLKKTYTELGNLGTKKIEGVFGEAQTQQIRQLVGESKTLKPALESAFNAIKTGNINEGLRALDEFEKSLNRIKGGALKQFEKSTPNRKSDIAEYIKQARTELQQMDSGVANTQAKLDQLKADKFNQISNGINSAKVQLDNFGNSATRAAKEVLETARATQNMESQLSGLQTQANYFFGLQNMLQLFRRGLRDTIQTVKDLDKAMTETAVVTDFSVSDMWNMLPEYTKLANKLGATTQGAYETMTLYFQQGLNKQQTFEIGEETMKMARIAGLDYAQTTNMMTAALRGFNMELNQTSAKRVNDVYSKLAAITASDTRELGLAMERTASIAHSANMDFGNTTAFLAQMIETTREAPENLGTAMKTIIARFQELKQNPYEISEVDGEEVDFNRVDKALKSIGVDLMDNRDKFRDLDDVFMDIASKWDTLSQTQQRYVATTAAGSRQQSRFLAMVQNYTRLKELTDAAANSEGASDVQFAKTLDSMEAKLNKLNNAWDQFTMGITNNELIKKGTGLLVDMLSAVNKFETGVEHLGDKIGGVFGDIFKSLTSFTGLLLAFKGVGKLTNIGIGMLGGMLGMGKGLKTGMFGGMTGMRQAANMAQARAISNPIVAAINRLTSVMTKGKVTGATQDVYGRGVGKQEFNNRRQQLRNLAVDEYSTPLEKNAKTAKAFNIGQFKGAFKDLNREEQAALYRGQKGTRQAIQRSFEAGVEKLKVSDSAQKAASRFYTDLDYAMANGSQHVENGLTQAFNPVQVGKMIGGDAGKEIYKAALEQRKNIIRELASQTDEKGNPLYRGKALEEAWRSKEASLYGQNIKLTGDEVNSLTSRMNGLTSAANGTGAAFMQVGMTLQSIGFERIGGIISTAGSALMSLGMTAEAASHAMKALKIESAGLAAALPGIGIGLGLAALAFGAAFAAFKIEQNRIKEIRKSGKQVVQAYEDTTKSVQENLNKLDKFKADWGKWAGGVDANGNNISLGSEEYQDYKKAVKEITQMQPSLIKGYNAEGEAIIDNNTALNEAIRLETERKKKATEDYLKGGQKIIDRRNSTERWQKGQRQKIGGSDYSQGAGAFSMEKSQIEKDARKVTDAIKKVDGGEELLKKWNITFDSLGNLTQDSINTIRDYGGDIQNELVKAFDGTNITKAQQDLLDNSQNAIAQLGKDFSGVEKVSQETFDALKVHATEQGFYDTIDSELISPFQKAIGRIAEQDLSWDDAQKAVNDLGKKYQQLGGHMQDFHDIQDKVAEAQREFGTDLDTDAYREKVETLTEPMDEWVEELENSTDQADQILAEWITQQKERFLDLSESLPTLEDGLNTLAGEIASANSAYDNWSKRTEETGDYYTASEGFKKMYDEVNDGVDDLGKKSQSWWSAAASMMGDDYVMRESSETVANHMKEIGKYFEEGQKGVDNFVSDLAYKFQNNELADGTFVSDYIKFDGEKLDFNIDDIPDEKFEQLAAAIGLSTDAFTALLNKARQFYDIDFSNVEEMRAAIAAGENAMVGEGKAKNGQQNLYMRESEFQAQALAATGDPDKVREAQEDLANAGVIFTKSAKELEKADLTSYFKDWGLANEKGKVDTNAFIAALDKMQYNKEEISDLYKNNQDLISDADTASFEDSYTAYKAAMDPTTSSVFSIQGTTEGILSAVNSMALSMGILTEATKQEIDAGVKEAESFDTDVTNYDRYKDYENQRSEIESGLTATLDMLEAAKDKATSESEKGEIQDKIDNVNKTLDTIKDANLSKTEFNEAKAEAAQTAVDNAKGKTAERYADTAIGENNKLDTSKLEGLINSVQKNVEGKNNQDNVIGQYLQNSSKALIDNGASNKEINASIQQAAKTMSEKGMDSKEIAAAINQGYGTHLKEGNIQKSEDGKISVDLDQSKLQEQLSSIHATIDAQVNIIGLSAKASGQNNHRFGTFARGSRKGYTIPGRPTLTGEEGEELVWEPKRNEAYMVGSNGPQFANISKDAVVWNAQQTKKIKKNSGSKGRFGTGARGITPIGTMKGGNAGGGGKGIKIPGLANIDAIATIQEVKEQKEKLEVSVIGKLDSIKEATNVEATATVTKVVKNGSVAGEPVKVQATASTSTPKVTQQQPKVTAGSQTMNVTANTAAAQAKINALVNIFKKTYTLKYKASGPSSIKVPISANFTGSWQKTVKINKSGARGQNNYIAHRMTPSFGSAAKGGKGTLGPKGRGGLTLTGEKGFEIAWLPGENRSMILGTQGPQMLKLPSDAVIWNHEQSKKILKKQQTIPAGSMGNSVGGSIPVKPLSSSSSSGGTSKAVEKAADTVAKKAEETAKNLGYVSVWWENIARKTEVTQRRMDDNSKAFEKYLKEMRATLKTTGESLASGGGGGDDYIKSISDYIGYNQAQVNRANAELNTLNVGTSAQQRAARTKTGKDDKKANKGAYNSGASSAVQISYKKGKKTKNQIINTAGYIKAENGTYVIDQAALDRVKNKDKRQAIKDALEKEINDRLSKKYAAEDNIKKAQEALEKMGEELYKTFFAWETELTKIWNLTKQIETTEGKVSRLKEYQELLNKQLTSGMVKASQDNGKFNNEVLDVFRKEVQSSVEKIRERAALLGEQKNAVVKAFSINDEKETLAKIQERLDEASNIADAQAEVTSKQAALNNAKSQKAKAQQDKKKAEADIKSLKKQQKKAKTKKEKKKIQKKINAAETKRANAEKILSSIDATIQNYQNKVTEAQSSYDKLVETAAYNLNETEKLGYEEYKKELEDKIKAQTTAQKYLEITQNADGTVKINFNTTDFEKDKLGGLLNETIAKEIQDYVKGIQEASEELNKTYETLTSEMADMYDNLGQLEDAWAGYADELWDISEESSKKEAEEFKKLSDSISKALKNLLDQVKKKLDERRKQEDNAAKEREISQKQQRLAALQADTAGGHQVEIAQLQKEIADAQQDYQRSLEDQLLEKLQEQADVAEQQRQRQIELQETISEGVNNAALVNLWMSDPSAFHDEIYAAYKSSKKYDESPTVIQERIDRDFEELYSGLTTNQQKQKELTKAIEDLEDVLELLKDSLDKMSSSQGKSIKQLHDDIGLDYQTIKSDHEKTARDFYNEGIAYSDARSTDFTLEELRDAGYQEAQAEIDAQNQPTTEIQENQTAQPSTTNTQQTKEAAYQAAIRNAAKNKKIGKNEFLSVKKVANAAGHSAGKFMTDLAATSGLTWQQVIKAAKDAGFSKYSMAKTFNSKAFIKAYEKVFGSGSYKKNKANKKGSAYGMYAQGGLADYTGPAWLDGTPSKPELVLNAADTKNFIALRDVLSNAMKSSGSAANSYGDATFEININVDHINSDYDVDQIADRVKKDIVKSAGYRNVAQVRNFR